MDKKARHSSFQDYWICTNNKGLKLLCFLSGYRQIVIEEQKRQSLTKANPVASTNYVESPTQVVHPSLQDETTMEKL